MQADTKVYKEKPDMVFDLDDYRRGLRLRANEAEVFTSDHHKVNVWTVQAGQAIPLHMHANSECIMIVMSGMGEYRMGDENNTYSVDEGMMMVAPPHTPHEIKNIGSGPLVLLTVEGPGPFDTKVLQQDGVGHLY